MSFTPIVSTTVTGETVYAETSQSIVNGGIANITTINSGGSQTISSGGAANNTIINGGFQQVQLSGVANSTTINSAGYQFVSSGGVANSTIISSGHQNIASSGVANSTIIFSGSQVVYAGGVANNTIINSGYKSSLCYQWVSSGGVANNTIINGGFQQVQLSGVANNTIINVNGLQAINSGGVASSATINSGGSQYVSYRGQADFTIINSGGSQLVYSNSIVNSTTINGGNQTISSGGVANNTIINSSGFQDVFSGGVANFTTIFFHAWQGISSGGVANNTIINSGGQFVDSGGIANSTTINSGGLQDLVSGGVANNTIINGGSQHVCYRGVANYTTINLGSQIVDSGGIANSTTVNSSYQSISSGGVANNTIINSSGFQDVFSGGVANSTIISSGHQNIASSGVANSTTINSGGSQNVYIGGVANFTIINSGGAQSIDSEGIANSTTIYSGGSQTVSGSVISTTINFGGSQNVYNGGVASNTIVNSGGSMYVSSGGIASGMLTLAGGYVTLADTSAVTALATMRYELANTQANTILLSVNSGTLGSSDTTYSLNLNNSVLGTYILANGADLSGMNGKNFTVTYNSLNINLKVGSSYTFATGNKLSLSYTDATTDQLVAIFSETIPPSIPSSLTRTVNGNNVSLKWADSTDAAGIKQYEVQVGNSSDSSYEYSASTAINTANVTSLADGTYYWRVRAQDNNDNYSAWSAWTSYSNFMIDTTAPSVPATLTRTVTGNSVALDWADATDSLSGIRQYEVQVDNNSDFSSPEYSVSSAISTANVTSLADGTYYWRVRAQDNNDNYSAWESGSNLTVDTVKPTVPIGLNQVVNGKNVIWGWTDATDATSGVKQYEIQVDNNNNFGSPEFSKQVATNQATGANLAIGTYYWHVRTQDNSNNWSAWSSVATFNVELIPPSVPTGLKQTVTGYNAAFNWTNSTDASGIRQYEFRGDNNADFSSPEYTDTVTGNRDTVTDIPVGTYYWKVRAQDNAGNWGAWSSSSKFFVTPADTAANTWQTATDIANLDNWVGFGDKADYYKLTMTNAGTLTLGLTGLTGNADLSLLNAYGITIKNSSNTGTTPEAINNVLLAGTYYVKIAAGASADFVGYTLTNAIKYYPTDTAANTWQTAGDISKLDSRVGFGDPADYYKLTMTNAGTLSLNLARLSGNADLSLLNSTGTVLKTSAKTGTADEAISNVLLLAGIYYVKVAAGTSVNDASYMLTNTIKYCPADTGANTWQTAGGIAKLDNWVGFGDTADVYRLTMMNAGTLTLGLTGLTGNANLSLLSSTGTTLKTSANTGTTSEAINNVSLLAGTYYVKVAAGTGVNDANYTLTHTEKYTPADTAANTWQTAKSIDDGVDTWVGFGDAADVYKLTMTHAGTLTLGLTGLTGNADLSLLNSAGTVLKSSAKTGTNPESINNVSLLAGTYYVKVAAGFGVNDAAYTLSHTVSYFAGDTYDKAGNTIATAKLIDAPTQTGWVGFGDSDDYYKFDIAKTTQGTLRLYDITGGNASLSLYNAKGILLKTSAKLGSLEDTLTSSLAAGTYYARVNAVSGNIDYKLDFKIKDQVGMLAS